MAASIAATLALAAVLVGKWDELATGLTAAPALVVAATVALQVIALVVRTEAWHVCVRTLGGTVSRRRLFRASSVGCVGNLLNAQPPPTDSDPVARVVTVSRGEGQRPALPPPDRGEPPRRHRTAPDP